MKKIPSGIARYRNGLIAVAVSQALLLAQAATPAPVAAMMDNRYLDMDLAQLMQVTITSVARKPQTLADTAAAVYVITQEDISRSGVTSIPEALAMAPGIQVARINASKWSVSSRGFAGYTSNKLLVLIDGRSVYSPAYSGTFWDMQNTMLEDIDRIEVIRGPGGTIWGANAVNGVINIITKKAQNTQGTLLRAGAGNQERFMGGARHGAKLGDTTYARLYITGNDRAVNVLTNSDNAHDGWNSLQTGFRADGTIGANNDWTLQGDLFRNKGDQLIFPYWLDVPPYLIANRSDLDNRGANLLGRWQHRIDHDRRLAAQVYYDNNARSEEFFNIAFQTLDAEFQYETLFGERHNLILGGGYRQIKGDNDNTSQAWIPSRSDDIYSLFLQDAARFLDDRVILTLGTKWEYNDYTGSEWQPSGKLLWKPSGKHSLWTGIARAVHTPSVNEQYGHVLLSTAPPPFGPGRIRLAGDQEFRSETVVAYEAGYRWQPSTTLSLDLAFFYNDYRNIYTVFPRPVPDGLNLIFVNNGEGYGYGMEAAMDWKVQPWLRLSLIYSLLKSDFDWQDPAMALDQFNGFIEGLTPRHQIGLRSSLDLAANWQMNAWLRYTDAIECRSSLELLQEGKPVDQVFHLDLNLIWKPTKNLEVMLAGKNLLNSSHLEYIAELITPPTEIERSFYAKVTWTY